MYKNDRVTERYSEPFKFITMNNYKSEKNNREFREIILKNYELSRAYRLADDLLDKRFTLNSVSQMQNNPAHTCYTVKGNSLCHGFSMNNLLSFNLVGGGTLLSHLLKTKGVQLPKSFKIVSCEVNYFPNSKEKKYFKHFYTKYKEFRKEQRRNKSYKVARMLAERKFKNHRGLRGTHIEINKQNKEFYENIYTIEVDSYVQVKRYKDSSSIFDNYAIYIIYPLDHVEPEPVSRRIVPKVTQRTSSIPFEDLDDDGSWQGMYGDEAEQAYWNCN